MDIIDQIGGWRSASGIEINYGHGYSKVQVGRWSWLVSISFTSSDGTYTLDPL